MRINGKSKEELARMSNEELTMYGAEIDMNRVRVNDYLIVKERIGKEWENRYPSIFKTEKVTLCTGHEVYHATHESTMAYGEGKTAKDAINDLKHRMA